MTADGEGAEQRQYYKVEAQDLLRERMKYLERAHKWNLLKSIDESQGYVPCLWDLLVRSHRAAPEVNLSPDDSILERSTVTNLPWDERLSLLAGDASGESEQWKQAVSVHAEVTANLYADGSVEAEIRKKAREVLTRLKDLEVRLARDEDNKELCACYANQATLHRLIGQFHDALRVLDKLHEHCRGECDRRGLLECCGLLALVYQDLHQHDKSEMFYKQKNAIAMALQYEEVLAYACWEWGILAKAQKKIGEAIYHLNRGAARLHDLGYFEEERKCLSDLNQVCQ
jgi:hypothetical protein